VLSINGLLRIALLFAHAGGAVLLNRIVNHPKVISRHHQRFLPYNGPTRNVYIITKSNHSMSQLTPAILTGGRLRFGSNTSLYNTVVWLGFITVCSVLYVLYVCLIVCTIVFIFHFSCLMFYTM